MCVSSMCVSSNTQHNNTSHSIFSNNTSEKDGAAFLVKDRRSGIHLNGSIFNGNEAQSLGAAVAAYQDTSLTVHGSEFKGGLAAKGSAIYATNALVTLSGTNSIPTPTFVI